MNVMVGLSGGVDSSVAALRLLEQGHQVRGLFMKNWEEDDASGTCTAELDAEDARRVAQSLGIEFVARNFAIEYWGGVFEHFLSELRAARTPNPDLLCNREVKFKTFVEHAKDLGASKIATGHYARIAELDGRWRLLRGVDNNKDQSYFLHLLDQEQLSVSLFPIGELTKPVVRRLAENAGLPTFAKKDSTGICFIGEKNFPQFIARYLKPNPGLMKTPDGKTIGQHQGLSFYTLGQRGGLHVGGSKDGNGEAWFVLGKEMASNTLIIGQGGQHPALFSSITHTEPAHWIDGLTPEFPLRCTAKSRYRQIDQPCLVEHHANGGLVVRFDAPQRAVTPGQSVVFYQEQECLGGAVIAQTNAIYGGLS
jgi:tRNA-uridine 2-sulfurtransferase